MSGFEYVSSPSQLIEHEFYALPHEMRLLEAQLATIRLNRGIIAANIGDTMGESSESWHDNAPAEALFGEMYQLDKREAGLISATKHLTQVPYPNIDIPFATIGSRLTCDISGDIFRLDISGNLPAMAEQIHEKDVEKGSISAPLPRALLGSRPLEQVRSIIGGQALEIVVVEVDQDAQQTYYSECDI